MNTRNDDPLDDLLAQWDVRGEASASFQREVWARIAAGETEPSWGEKLSGLLFGTRGWLTMAAAAIVIGAGTAWIETSPTRLNPHEAYVRSISPFASLHLASH